VIGEKDQPARFRNVRSQQHLEPLHYRNRTDTQSPPL